MTCLTEFKCSVYVDGEVAENEAREITAHLAVCGTCRRLVESLRVESGVLVRCFRDTEFIEFELEDEQLSAPQAATLTVAKFAAFVLAMSVLLQPIFSLIGDFEIPLSASAQFSLFVDGLMYGIPAGIQLVNSFLAVTSWIVAGAILFFGLFLAFRRSPVASALVSIFALLTVFSPWTYAIDVRRSEKPINVPAGETIDDTLVVAGDSVNIEGTINGDLIAIAREVLVKGTIKGNLISCAERTEVEGTVDGSIVGAGGFVEMRGQTARNLYALAGSLSVSRQARIDGNATMFVGEGTLEGTIGKDFTAYTAISTGWGPFQTRLFSRGGKIHVLAPARVGRNLFLKVDEKDNVIIDSNVTVGGKTDVQIPPQRPLRYATASFYVWQTIWLAAAFLTGLLFFRLVPAFARVSLNSGNDLLLAAGVGFLSIVAPPIAAVLASLTLIGLPLGLMTFAIWIAAAYLAKIVIAGFIGRSLLASGGDAQPSSAPMLLAGLIPIFIAINLPYVGSVINFLLIVLGLGAIVITAYRKPRWSPSGSPAALAA